MWWSNHEKKHCNLYNSVPWCYLNPKEAQPFKYNCQICQYWVYDFHGTQYCSSSDKINRTIPKGGEVKQEILIANDVKMWSFWILVKRHSLGKALFFSLNSKLLQHHFLLSSVVLMIISLSPVTETRLTSYCATVHIFACRALRTLRLENSTTL